jgi:hypothetical protein
MRPVVVSTSDQADHFYTLFRTLGQIQHSADAIARTPIGVVRSILAGRSLHAVPERPVVCVTCGN